MIKFSFLFYFLLCIYDNVMLCFWFGLFMDVLFSILWIDVWTLVLTWLDFIEIFSIVGHVPKGLIKML